MLEGGLMKFLAKGATEKIVEDADEKRERYHINPYTYLDMMCKMEVFHHFLYFFQFN